MKKYENKIHLSYVFIGMVILVFILGAEPAEHTNSSGSNARNNLNQTTIKPLRIDNKTRAFEIASVERNGRNVRLTLKNNYNKAITAYALSPGVSHTIYELADEEAITPGGTREENLAIQPRQQEDKITLLAVMLNDKTGDGDDKVVTEIKDLRSGEKTQLGRIIPHLQVLLNIPNDQLEVALLDVKAAIKNLPGGSEQESSHVFITGLRGARESMLRELEGLEQLRRDLGNDIFKRALAKTKERRLKIMEKY